MPTVLQHLCDPHFGEDAHVGGVSFVVSVNGVERVLILCDDHAKSLVTPLLDMMHEHGAKPTEASKVPPPRRGTRPEAGRDPLPEGMTIEEAQAIVATGRCLFDASHGPFNGRNAVSAHMRTQHGGVTITSLGLGKQGQPVPKPSDDGAHGHTFGDLGVSKRGDLLTDAQGHKCPDCESNFGTQQGVAAHRAKSHGYRRAS